MPAQFFGYNAPFLGVGVVQRQEDERIIKNDLLRLLLTIPGERIYRPTFGTPLRGIVFESLDDARLIELSDSIESAIIASDERLVVNSVVCSLSDPSDTLSVTVDVSIINNQLTRYVLDLSFDSNGTLTIVR